MLETVPLDQFYSNATKFLHDLLNKNQLKLLATKDFIVQKGELQTVLQSKSTKHTGSFFWK